MKNYGSLRRHVWALPLEIVMLCGVAVLFLRHDWLHFAEAVFALAVSFLPLIFERVFRVCLPMFFQTVYVLFVSASMFAGEALRLYGRVTHWDDWVHFTSGLLVGLAAILLVTAMTRHRDTVRLPKNVKPVVVLLTAVAVAAIWEIIEFTSDQLFGTHSQEDSLFDTMTDIIYGSTGGLIMATLFSLYLHGKKTLGLRTLIDHYENYNS